MLILFLRKNCGELFFHLLAKKKKKKEKTIFLHIVCLQILLTKDISSFQQSGPGILPGRLHVSIVLKMRFHDKVMRYLITITVKGTVST